MATPQTGIFALGTMSHAYLENAMLDSMAARGGGSRDRLTDFTHAVTGAYYFVPASEALAMFAEQLSG